MKIVSYTPEDAARLRTALAKANFEAPLLERGSYVRHMFQHGSRSHLYLLLANDGEVIGTLGSEYVRLRNGQDYYQAAILSNTYSFEPGAFAFLLNHWMKSCEIGIVFPGNKLLNDIVAQQKRWSRVPGLNTFWLNWNYPSLDSDSFSKRLLKPLLRHITRVDSSKLGQKINRHYMSDLSVIEEPRIDDEMIERKGIFGVRLEEDSIYLNWRFSTDLDYTTYRIFRVVRNSETRGFVVLADWPHCVIVSMCDGDDPRELALGILLAIAKVNTGIHRHRKVLLSSMHADMREIFQAFGFRPDRKETPFYVAAFGSRSAPRPSSDWLINLDFGDAGTTMGLVYKP